MGQPRLDFHVRGPFVVQFADGKPLVLRGMRDKALLAILALSPKHGRSRRWLVDKLWSDRFVDHGRMSLRQVLANLRKAFGPDHAAYFTADRTNVSLVCNVRLIRDCDAMDAELFEDIEVRDPEFDDWLREHRRVEEALGAQTAVPQFVPSKPSIKHRVTIALALDTEQITREERLVAETLLDRVANLLSETGTARAILSHQASGPDPQSIDAHLEIRCLASEGEWFANVRVTPRDRQYYAWTGRLRLPMKLSAIWEGPDLAAFAGRIQEGVVHTLSRSVPEASYLALHRASQMLFSGNATRIDDADRLLETIVHEDGSAAALAWRGYAALTRALEFNGIAQADRDAARGLIDEALEMAPTSALVQGLASIVYMKLLGDTDYGHHLAVQATSLDDRNVYALDALSQALFFRGEHERSFHLSDWARQAAQHSPNAFNWDMRSALSALSLGRITQARELAQASHLKAPHYRPALRYLYALYALEGNLAEAEKYRKLLTAREPGFRPETMLTADYPVETLRRIGLIENLPFVR